jgi:hypothetical protein
MQSRWLRIARVPVPPPHFNDARYAMIAEDPLPESILEL